MTFFGKDDLIQPMTFLDKPQWADALGTEGNPQPMTQEQFLAELDAECEASDRKRFIPTQPQGSGVSAETAVRVLGIPKREPTLQVAVVGGNMSAAAAAQAGAVPPMPDLAQMQPPSGKKDGPTPLDLVKKMKTYRIMIVRENTLYMHAAGYYRALEKAEAETEIWIVCREEVEKAGSRSILTGAYQLLLIDPDLKVNHLLPADGLIPFRNGLLRLEDGMLIPHSPQYFVTFVVQCDYTPAYGCPVFEQYLRDVTGGDPLLMDRIWEFIGCCLTKVDLKRIFVVQGRSNGGKSALINLLQNFFPGCVQSYLNAHDLGKEFSMIEYKGKQFCVCGDMKSGWLDEAAVSNLKKASGRDILNANVKYGARVEFRFNGHIVLVTNHPILTKEYDAAFWGRLLGIPFFYSISAEKEDRNLEQKLRAELPAIAYRAVWAFFRLRSNNYCFSGDFPVNSPQLFDEAVPAADPDTLVYLFLQQHFEAGREEDMVVIEEVCKAFNTIYHTHMSPIQFSGLFCQQAAQMYGAEKVRSRAGGFKNARSCLKNIRIKH